MAERTPLYMDINNVYSGDEMGLPNRDFISEGVVLATDMAVTAGAGNTVNIAAGAAWIVGDTDIVNQPTYRIINDAVVNLGINPDPTNPRIVRVGMQINDAGFSGVLRNGVLTAIHGTPAGSPVAPAEPASFLTLATVLVPAAAASSAAYTFTDARPRARVGAGQALGSGMSLLWDSVDAGVTLPTASITTPTLVQTYKHLRVVLEGRSNAVANTDDLRLRFNSDAGANYFRQLLQGSAAVASAGETGATNDSLGPVNSAITAANALANSPGIAEIDILNYASTTFHKLVISRVTYRTAQAGSGMVVQVWGGGWASTAAISTLTFALGVGSFIAGSRISVYGEA